MIENKNDIFTILNYQGSKKNLLEFIINNIEEYINSNKAVLDIFAGTSAVGYALKRKYNVYANDSELYAYTIAKALLCFNEKNEWKQIENEFVKRYKQNLDKLGSVFSNFINKETKAIKENDSSSLRELYNQFPIIWKQNEFNYWENKIKDISDLRKYKNEIPYMLFTTYYSSTYFGIEQSVEIDSIRYAIEDIENENIRCMLLSSLYYAMKECVFSKDGHMAQPLDICGHDKKLISVRRKCIYSIFKEKVEEFCSDKFLTNINKNCAFNMTMEKLISNKIVKDNVGFIYADPPYTDMQYSRYYHLLNTVTLYDYMYISTYRGQLSKGLYREERFQSPLSQRSQAAGQMKLLFDFCKSNCIDIGVSFAYPRYPEIQATNRYTMSIEELVYLAENIFGKNKVQIVEEEYEHSNNRNASTKKVLEYLILCKS